MTVTLDLPPTIAGRVEADARAHGQAIADFLRDAVTDLYKADGDDVDTLPADVYERFPFHEESLADDLRAGFADIDAGRVTEGDTFFAELRAYAGRK